MARTMLIAASVMLGVVLAALAGEKGIESQKVKEVENFLDRQLKAFDVRDLKALMDMLAKDPSVVMLGNGPNDRWVGPEAIKKAYESQLLQYESEKISLHGTIVGVQDNIAWFSTQAHLLKKTKAQGQSMLRINWSGVLQKRKGKWLLVQSHFSLPTGK